MYLQAGQTSNALHSILSTDSFPQSDSTAMYCQHLQLLTNIAVRSSSEDQIERHKALSSV